MSDILPGDDVAAARYTVLCTAIGREPVSAYHRAVLARLAAWTNADDIDALAYLIRARVDRQTGRYRDLVAEVARHLHATGSAGEGWTFMPMPTVLAALIREAARNTEGDHPDPTDAELKRLYLEMQLKDDQDPELLRNIRSHLDRDEGDPASRPQHDPREPGGGPAARIVLVTAALTYSRSPARNTWRPLR